MQLGPWRVDFGAVNAYVLPLGPLETNAYLLTRSDEGDAVLVDAPEGAWEAVKPLLEADGCTLKQLWLTHGHWDHTQGAAELIRHTKAQVLGHQADRELYENPRVMSAVIGIDMNLEPVKVDYWVGQGEVFESLGESVEVRHVPGHCPGNILFYLPKARVAFVGDALFRAAVGRADLPGGSFEQLEASIREQIYTLPDTTTVYPGHGPETTVGHEMETNPYVRLA